ncbi:hypothetical protein KC19_5G187000 [Ceratodon purpureus]|uniref:fructokinase n=1 Tax=Ceratodon purpureus TaxID=3225 RepID=A0A8T0I332_CERPU|nr:hypothetical protein KC19_5G187000 [Ceratodon purpureus]
MATSYGGGLVYNLCNVAMSSRTDYFTMKPVSGSQSNCVSKGLLPRPSGLRSSFLPPTPGFATQRALQSVQSHKVQHVSASAKTKDDLVVCFGELLIDFVPTIGGVSLADAPAFKKAPGGAPANVACGISKLGGNAAFVGKVGDDEFGYMLCDVLKDQKVETKGVRFDAHARTALAFVTLRSDGEREFMFYRNPSADMLFEIQELDTDLLKQASILHYGSISLITEPSRSTHLEALRIAQEAGSLLSYDPNLRLPLWPSAEAAKEGIMSIWDKADIIKVSDEEVVFLTGHDPKDDAANMKMLHPGCKLMLVTEGGEGCRYYTPKFYGQVGGFKVQVVDTTGAGDAFCAGLLSQLAVFPDIVEDEAKLREALLFANACGAITTTERGAIPSLPDKETVSRLLSTAHRLSV